TVEDAAHVGVMHGASRGRREVRRRLWIERSGGEPVGEALALDELHGEVAPAVVLADLVDRHDMRVVETGDGLGLVAEASEVVVAGPGPCAEHLQRDEAVEGALAGLVDDAHAAAAEDAVDLVVAEVTHACAAGEIGATAAIVAVAIAVTVA